jgi:alpha-D-ribose 1-methylphosphonate 5-triphosphate synthase subunit PhnG
LNSTTPTDADTKQRQQLLAVLSKCSSKDIKALWQPLNLTPNYQLLKSPEIGMVMVKAKTGGNGSPFNMGEMTVTRTVLRLDSNQMGYGYIAGRDKEKSLLIAMIDACYQVADWQSEINQKVLEPLQAQHNQAYRAHAQQVEKTKVNFFTMVRGE